MSDVITVDHVALSHAAGDLARAVQASRERIDQLAGELASLHTDWYGQAQQAYFEAKAVWETAQRQMQHVLASLSSGVVEANHAYQAADVAGARAFR
ncbi:WXG100 family type VII secretion target [Nocardioides sp.]|uniref:WXG100 family type VII secretion target n=1 Tax=Nocardioides sp. TaxID=35761 RepID=UPI0039E561E6